MEKDIPKHTSQQQRKIHQLYWIIGILVFIIIGLVIFLCISLIARHMDYQKLEAPFGSDAHMNSIKEGTVQNTSE